MTSTKYFQLALHETQSFEVPQKFYNKTCSSMSGHLSKTKGKQYYLHILINSPEITITYTNFFMSVNLPFDFGVEHCLLSHLVFTYFFEPSRTSKTFLPNSIILNDIFLILCSWYLFFLVHNILLSLSFIKFCIFWGPQFFVVADVADFLLRGWKGNRYNIWIPKLMQLSS